MPEITPYNCQGGEIADSVLVIDRFMPDDVCAKLSRAGDALYDADLLPSFGPNNNTCGLTKVLKWAGCEGDDFGRWVRKAAERIHQGIREVDWAVYSRLATGGRHQLHADNAELDGGGNHTPRRMVSVGVYLGSYGIDFGGGVLEFPKLNMNVTPTKGMLVAFPSDLMWQHRVTNVDYGTRESLFYWYR